MGVERAHFISAMRRVANTVTVVTTDGPAGRHGATVSAFCSVSADPPTVLVCLNASSKISRLVSENRQFNVNVLPADAPGLAARFCGAEDHLVSDRFDNIETGNKPSPSLEGATVLVCELDQTIPSGSHQIMIGRVVEAMESTETPLTYFDGAYHAIMPLDQAKRGARL